MKFHFGGGPRKAAHSVKANRFCFDEINECADVSFHRISFRVVFTYFITRNEISFLSNDCNEITPGMSFISDCII